MIAAIIALQLYQAEWKKSAETEFRFNASFLRVPREFKYVIVAADPTRTKYIDGKERSIYKKITFLENSTVYSGMVLLNIHSEKENTPCRDAYIPHNQHYLTSKKGKKEKIKGKKRILEAPCAASLT